MGLAFLKGRTSAVGAGGTENYLPRTRQWFLQPETRAFWTDAEDEVQGLDGAWQTSNKATIWRWRDAFQNDFAARMQWTVKSFAEANHPPVPRLDQADHLTAHPGDVIELSAERSSDPDGDTLAYSWFTYGEAGTFVTSRASTGAPIRIDGADTKHAKLTIPTDRVFRLGELHVILAVTDTGEPPITRYHRLIVDVRP